MKYLLAWIAISIWFFCKDIQIFTPGFMKKIRYYMYNDRYSVCSSSDNVCCNIMYGYDVDNFEELYDTFMYMMSYQHMSYLFYTDFYTFCTWYFATNCHFARNSWAIAIALLALCLYCLFQEVRQLTFHFISNCRSLRKSTPKKDINYHNDSITNTK